MAGEEQILTLFLRTINKNTNVLYDGCIYLTDGYAPAPEIKPRCKVFWVITPEGSLGSHLKFGRALQINN